MHLNHLAIAVTDLERSTLFYQNLFAVQELRRQPYAVWFDLDGIILMLEATDQGVSPSASGLNVLALQIDPTERSNWTERLNRLRIPIESETAFSLYFRDPDGYRLAVSHYPQEASREIEDKHSAGGHQAPRR